MIPRRFRRVAVPLIVGAVALGLTGCSGSNVSSNRDAATITYRDASGDQTIHITTTDFKSQLADLVGSTPFQKLLASNSNFKLSGDQENTTSANISASYLGSLVEQSAIDAEFTSLGLKLTDKQRGDGLTAQKQSFGEEVFASFTKSFQNTLAEQNARAMAVATYFTAITPAKEQALYDQFASVICPSGKNVAHILVKDKATASALLSQIQGGASFAELAKTTSTDTASGKLGGELGCLRTGAFVKEFEDAAFGAKLGTVVGPVKSQYGYHLIVVRPAEYASVRDQLAQALQRNPGSIVKDLRLQQMKVRINPQFGTGGLAVNQQQGVLTYQVKPPAVPVVRTCREAAFPCTPTTTAAPSSVPAGG